MKKVIILHRKMLLWSLAISFILMLAYYMRWYFPGVLALPKWLLFDSIVIPITLTVQSIHIRTRSLVLTAFLLAGLSALNFLPLWFFGLTLSDGESQIIGQFILRIWLVVQTICTIAYLYYKVRNK